MRFPLHAALTLTVLVLGTACADSDVTSSRPDAQLPIRSLAFLVDSDSRGQFLGQIESIAKHHDMEYRATQVSPDAVFWVAEMANADFRVIVANDLKAEQYDLSAYGNETTPVPEDQLDQFLREIQSATRGVPGVRVLGRDDAIKIAD
jgi:hypothetical protein